MSRPSNIKKLTNHSYPSTEEYKIENLPLIRLPLEPSGRPIPYPLKRIKGEMAEESLDKEKQINKDTLVSFLNNIKDSASTGGTSPRGNPFGYRPGWDQSHMAMAIIASLRSPSPKLKVGSVIVFNNRIVSTGYNGYPSGVPHISEYRDGKEMNTIHAEQNAILNCTTHSIGDRKDFVIYVTHFPCIHCTKSIIGFGIRHIKYNRDRNNDPLAIKMLEQSKVKVERVV